MIDLKKVREDVDGYKQICKDKNQEIDVDAILAKDDKRKESQQEIDDLKHQQKELAAKKDYDGAKNIKSEIQTLEEDYKALLPDLEKDLLTMPNTTIHPDVPVGKGEEENVVLKKVGDIPTFDFEMKDHIELMKKHDMIDIER